MRYAIYFTPPRNHPLTLAASDWLGRDAFSHDADTEWMPHERGVLSVDEWRSLTQEPRRYGFHGTIVAPFRLSEQQREDALFDAFDAFCASHSGFAVTLEVAALGNFLALLPVNSLSALSRLARQAVETFDDFRAPLTEVERARRKPEALTDNQRAMLDRHGYPYTMDEFRFHMTLTDRIDDTGLRNEVRALLEERLGNSIAEPVLFEDLAIFMQPAPDQPFQVVRQMKLGSEAKRRQAP
ncbi:hypothetical protein B7H23_03980 [Notoacmeibacter marinus]|uniref:Phosphonate metabolism protein n=1 Tax=Notoacmeibacter marinus TaxID=1876515 RepID=A0A231V1V8_9HYPH|nr:DUF1045 domain-containing protein [Notoacmeibacter marinus]OXT02094.1 hypothetical protein B7H23_03980 [Notoacmeibacter marinus]